MTQRFRTSDFEYQLPPELIAQTPSERRGGSRLLVVERDAGPGVAPADRTFADFPGLVAPGDLVVLNTTRVRHARLLGTRPSGAPAEVLLLHPGPGESWVAMGKPGSALRPGRRIRLGEGAEIETLDILEEGYRLIAFRGVDAATAMARHGLLPLPPYIERPAGPEDEERYQTIYAEREGSVAAPTAGLHFTPDLLSALRARGAAIARVDLEVGPGTFKPVETESLEAHPMHAERYEIPEASARAIADTRERGGAVWAVGTTVVRSLESAADETGRVHPGPGETRLMITPGYRFRAVDRLLTNFHLPRSTLLMLVAAFAGYETTMAAYRHAVAARYRFYSYGDAMAIIPPAAHRP
ncbi:MAG TPA: tRNA preQ1(34) S-adenosylmethionine ribosyltransferase-isomerase QueA [Gemmatimonadales bacterium]|nr:tRNA preQ1(34) S-adenosylmethionine ribosyltransferase-isomerase QueA [Gemmatimonadales bacterium]